MFLLVTENSLLGGEAVEGGDGTETLQYQLQHATYCRTCRALLGPFYLLVWR